MNSADQEYLQRRQQECLAHAGKAADPGIAEVHRQFAAEYERKLATSATLSIRHGDARDRH